MHPTRGQQRVSARTLRRWVRSYRREGVQGLIPRARKGSQPRFLTTEALAHALELLVENPRRNTLFLIKEVELQFPQLKGKLAVSTLNRHLKAAHAHRRVVPKNATPGSYTAFEAAAPNDLWQSDVHHGLVALVAGNEVPVRIVLVSDDSSRTYCHCQAYPDERLPSLEHCLKQAMLKYGIPKRFYTDCGAIYCSIQFALICADLGIHAFTSHPYSPWTHGKVERQWDIQEDQLWSELALLPPMPIDKLNRYLQAWVEAEHHDRVHRRTGEALGAVAAKCQASSLPQPGTITTFLLAVGEAQGVAHGRSGAFQQRLPGRPGVRWYPRAGAL